MSWSAFSFPWARPFDLETFMRSIRVFPFKFPFQFLFTRHSSHRLLALALLAPILPGGCDSLNGGGGNDARIRLLNVSAGYASVDLYVNEDDNESDQLTITGASYGTVSDYAELNSDTYTIRFKRNGVMATLLTLSDQQLADDSHATYVAYGSTGSFSTFKVEEDEDEPDSGKALLHVLNAAETGTLDVYLTEESASLDDSSPIASTGTTADATIDSGTYRLRVTGSDDTRDLRLDLSDVTFDSEQIVSLVLAATPGGVLVDAFFLPQEGDLSTRANTKARVRAAIGIANGTSATLSVGGVNLLTAATPGAISSRYAHVDAGSAGVDLSINGTVVPVPNQTLTAGADYTLLVWDNGSGTQTTLISDDNRLPTTADRAKMRLLNGMSGLGEPITLSVDFSPIAEGVALGQASSPALVDSGIESQLDITNANTAATLLTRPSTTLAEAGVYTMFMTGGGTMAVNGTLRKDR
jgi:WD40 repeat protein